MASKTDRVLARVSTWSTVAVLISLLAVPFLPPRQAGHPPQPVKPQQRAKIEQRVTAKVPPLVTPAIPAAQTAQPQSSPPTKAASTHAPAAPVAATSDKPADQSAGTAAEAAAPEDVWTEAQIKDGLRACLQELAPVVAEVTLEEPMKKGPCGTPAPVRLLSIGAGSKVTFDPAPQMNCHLAAGLADWVDRVLQPAAREVLGSRITRIIGSASYSCRHMYSNSKLPLSEHATGNAIDIAGFVTADGRTVRVAKSWGPTERDIAAAKRKLEHAKAAEKTAKKQSDDRDAKAKADAKADGKDAAKSGKSAPAKPEKASVLKAGFKKAKTDDASPEPAAAGLTAAATVEAAFLRRLHHGACTVFGTVLGPEANEAHRDHFHLDMKERRHQAICH